jgi:hypothetical protein
MGKLTFSDGEGRKYAFWPNTGTPEKGNRKILE